MATPSVANFQREASPPTTSEERQFARFIEAANQLGENLDVTFNASFEKLVSQSLPQPEMSQEYGSALTPLTPEQEDDLCARLENGERCPGAPKIIRKQAHEIAGLLDRLSRAYALVPNETFSLGIRCKRNYQSPSALMRVMSEMFATQFESFAECCLELARCAKTPEHQARFVRMAQEYRQAKRLVSEDIPRNREVATKSSPAR